jgi:aconitate hydratase
MKARIANMNSFSARSTLTAGNRQYEIFRLDALSGAGYDLSRFPFSLKIWLENLLRTEDGQVVTADHIRRLAGWQPDARAEIEIPFTPARVLLQDLTGVPCIADLAAMRQEVARLGGDPNQIDSLRPVELVIDHSLQVDAYGSEGAPGINAGLEFERNRERYAFLRWGQRAFRNLKVVPPDTGIVHQVNLEYLARVVFTAQDQADGRHRSARHTDGADAPWQAYPDTLVGADSHTTMANGLGVLGWGVGGIEAEAAMLGQPIAMLMPQVVGFRLEGTLQEGVTATDLVLTVTQMLRSRGVVGKFVEFFGPGLCTLPVADRTTIANMAPEYGATCGLFPVDEETLRYLRVTGRSEEHVQLVEAYCRAQGLFHTAGAPEATYSDLLELDLSTVEPSLAGPKRPQDRVALAGARRSFHDSLRQILNRDATPGEAQPDIGRWEGEGGTATAVARQTEVDALKSPTAVKVKLEGDEFTLDHGSVVIASITSCTNTSNPSVMVAAGLLARKAVELGLRTPPWVKTSLAPGSKVVTEYLRDAGLLPYLDALRFNVVGYGCTTCIGNSGPLPEPVSRAVDEGNLVVVSVLSGNRNFGGRIHSEVKANYLMSPPLVVAFALAGRIDVDLVNEPLGAGADGRPVYLRDIWPSRREIQEVMDSSIRSEMYKRSYADLFTGDERWNALDVPTGDLFAWDPDSTYIRRPPYFEGTPYSEEGRKTKDESAATLVKPWRVPELTGARALALLGHGVTTDHISPAGAISKNSPAGRYLLDHGVQPDDFNSYGSRRGNHEVMMRGTFANVRLRNRLAPGTEDGFTTYLPTGELTSIYEAAMRYRAKGIPLLLIAGREFGFGSSRDWAAKGPALLGVRAVIAESYERIYRSNLIGMSILPLQFSHGESAQSLGLTGYEVFYIVGLPDEVAGGFANGKCLTVRARRHDGEVMDFMVQVRIDTAQELEYYRHGGILPYVLRRLVAGQERLAVRSGSALATEGLL